MALWDKAWPGASIRLGQPQGAAPLDDSGRLPLDRLPAGLVAPISVVVSANFTAVAGRRYLVDTTAGPVTGTLPTGASTDAEIQFGALNDSWTTNSLTVDPGAAEIDGEVGALEFCTPDDFVFRFSGAAWRLI